MQSSSPAPSASQAAFSRAAHRVSLACLPCRSRHVKCNATKPNCSRCISDGVSCTYTRSRRGYRHPKKQDKAVTSRPESQPRRDDDQVILLPSPTASSSCTRAMSAKTGSSTTFADPLSLGPEPIQQDRSGIDEDLIGLYYTYFHASHPCALPRWALQQHSTSHPELFAPILRVMQYIGSLFDPAVSSEPLKELASTTVGVQSDTSSIITPHEVQAALLLGIALYWCDEVDEGLDILDQVLQAALKLQMHQNHFAVDHGQDDPVLTESWIRTWWQLYVTDGNIAGSTHSFPTRLGHVEMDVALPCEEEFYESGNIPTSRTLEQYNMREFLPEVDEGFSSFAHLVGLTRTLDLVLTHNMPVQQNLATVCSQVDISLSAWSSLLPQSKRSLLNGKQDLDVQLFKANMLVNTYLVHLHRQLSALAYSEVESVSRCAPPAPSAKLHQSTSEATQLHTSKAILAFRRMSDLLHLPANIVTCSPFIICMIANTLVAHLSACRYIFRGRTLQLERERVRSSMGALRLLGEFWPMGKRIYREMGIIAREILALSDQDIPRIQPRSEMPHQALPTSQPSVPDMALESDIPWFDFENISQSMLTTSCDTMFAKMDGF